MCRALSADRAVGTKDQRYERAAVNALRLLAALFSRPGLRGNPVKLSTFLFALLRPLLDLLHPPGYAIYAIYI